MAMHTKTMKNALLTTVVVLEVLFMLFLVNEVIDNDHLYRVHKQERIRIKNALNTQPNLGSNMTLDQLLNQDMDSAIDWLLNNNSEYELIKKDELKELADHNDQWQEKEQKLAKFECGKNWTRSYDFKGDLIPEHALYIPRLNDGLGKFKKEDLTPQVNKYQLTSLLDRVSNVVFDNQEEFMKEFYESQYGSQWDDLMGFSMSSEVCRISVLLSCGTTAITHLKTAPLIEWVNNKHQNNCQIKEVKK